MSRYGFVACLICLVFSPFGMQSALAASRGDVATGIQANCSSDEVTCLKAVNEQIASLHCNGTSDTSGSQSCSCSAEAIDVASGLADATSAVSKVNVPLSILMAQTVAKNAVACAQVAFGAVLDGIGTAAVVVPPPASLPASAG